jgi:hypothetical protein
MKGISEEALQEAMSQGPFKDVRLWIGLPSQSDCKMQFAMSLGLLVHHMTTQLIMFNLDNKRGSILPGIRQKILDDAIKQNATHLLFIDSDQIFPMELAAHWLTLDKPVIAANISTKEDLARPTAKRRVGGVFVPHYSDITTEPFTKVARVGTGIMMLKREVFEKLPRPAFTPYWNSEIEDYVFEDWKLCEHLEEMDVPILVDNKISMVIGHVGEKTYTMGHVAATRKWEQDHEHANKRPDSQPRIITSR